MKRLLDLAAAIVLLTGLSPIMMLAAVLVRWKMGAPILFKQLRPVYGENPFTYINFVL